MARVLIVDDVESIRITLSMFVEQAGHTISLAADASEALALLREERFDVVVTDIILPRKTGVVLLGEIREAQPDVQVIMITGEPEVGTAAEAVRKGAFDYLSKPVSREAITRTVSAAAAKKALLDKNRLLEDENRRHREHLEELVEERTEQLRDSEARYRGLFTHIADPIFVFDKKTSHFLDCNQSALDRYEYTLDELRTMIPLDLHPAEEKEQVSVNIADPEDFSSNQYVHVTKSGNAFPVEVHTNPLVYQGKEAWITIVRDVTERKQSEEMTKHLLNQQTCINDLSLELGNISDIDRIYESIYRHVSVLMDAKSFLISFYDEEQQLLRAGCALFQDKTFDVSKLPPIPLAQEGHGTQSRVIHTGEPLYVPDYREARKKASTEYTVDPKGTLINGAPPEGEEDITRSTLYVPLKLQGKVIGVMQVQSNRLDGYTEEDMALLSGLANVTAVAIANSRLVQEIRAALDGIVQIVGDTVEIRDPYTAGHQRRVAELACAIGKELGLSEEKREGLRVACLLHDIGKMSVPAEILSKPTRLTEIEFSLIQTHSQVAYDLLKRIHFQWPVAQIVLQHHERMDGSGYPQRLKGDEILLEARIIAVADTVEAMSSHRPYRAGLGIGAALEEIKSKRGLSYDSDVADACLRVFDAGFTFSNGDAEE